MVKNNFIVLAFGFRKRRHKDTEEVQKHSVVESGYHGEVNELQSVNSLKMNQNGVNEETGNTKSKKKKKDTKGSRKKDKNN